MYLKIIKQNTSNSILWISLTNMLLKYFAKLAFILRANTTSIFPKLHWRTMLSKGDG